MLCNVAKCIIRIYFGIYRFYLDYLAIYLLIIAFNDKLEASNQALFSMVRATHIAVRQLLD